MLFSYYCFANDGPIMRYMTKVYYLVWMPKFIIWFG